MLREDGRSNAELRKCRITRNINRYAEGSCLITLGHTRVHCTASVEDRQPNFLRDTEEGWVTAEYAMLPRATAERTRRAGDVGISGRTHEIQRLIGRSLRAVTDTKLLGPVTIQIDCDVLQADGGTRTAAICGGFVSLASLIHRERHRFDRPLLVRQVAAVSVGILDGQPLLDPDYSEDRDCAVDGHVVKTADGKLIDIGFTAEGAPFAPEDFSKLLALADQGLGVIFERQRDVIPGGLTL